MSLSNDSTPTGSLKGRLQDAVGASVEAGVEIAATVIGDVVFDGIVGSLLPGAASAVLSYRQRRMERNLTEFVLRLAQRLDELQPAWERLTTDRRERIRDKFAGIVADYVVEEKEVEKVRVMADGLARIILSDDELDERKVIEYYDLLEKLRVIDFQVLVDYVDGTYWKRDSQGCYDRGEGYMQVREVARDELAYIEEKLENLGLLKSNRTQEWRDPLKYLAERVSNPTPGLIIHPPGFQLEYRVANPGKWLVSFFVQVVRGHDEQKPSETGRS